MQDQRNHKGPKNQDRKIELLFSPDHAFIQNSEEKMRPPVYNRQYPNQRMLGNPYYPYDQRGFQRPPVYDPYYGMPQTY